MHSDDDAVSCMNCTTTLTGRDIATLVAMRAAWQAQRDAAWRATRDYAHEPSAHQVWCPECKQPSYFGPFEPGDYRLLDCAHAFLVRGTEPGLGEYTLTTEPPV